LSIALISFFSCQSGEDSLTSSIPGVTGEPEKLSEVTDLNKRLTVLQTKRAEDKVRIKELEKYKAQYVQVGVTAEMVC